MTDNKLGTLTLADYQAVVSGIQKYCPNATFSVASQSITAPQAVTLITTIINALTAIPAAKTGWVDARQAAEQAVAQNGELAKAIRNDIALMFSTSATTLQAFAIAPKKVPQPLSVEAKAAAAAKRAATRAARGTKGSKQKAAITGNVTGVTITPVTTPAAAPSATPQASAASSTPAPEATPASATPLIPAPGAGMATTASTGSPTLPHV